MSENQPAEQGIVIGPDGQPVGAGASDATSIESGNADEVSAGEVSDVMTIAVVPRARRTGLGRVLLEELITRSRAQGACRLLLEVRADNEPALGLYTARGFQRLSTRRGYYPGGVDALVLALDLREDA